MTSRERVTAALNHREPDKAPVDFSGHRSSGIMAIAYAALKKHLGITSGGIYVYDFIQQLAIVDPEMLDRFEVDVIELGRGFAQDDAYWKDWVLPDGTACKIPGFIDVRKEGGDWIIYCADGVPIAVQREASLYFEQTHTPWPEAKAAETGDLAEAFSKIMWCSIGTPPAPIGFDQEGLKELKRGAQELRASTDKAIIGLFGGNLNEVGQWLFGMENFFCYLAAEPAIVHRALDRLVDMYMGNLEKFLSAVGDSIDIVMFGDDLGMQTGPQMSKKMYDEFFKPRHQTMWMRAKELADVKVMLHCCGGVHELMPSLIEAGLDVINPVQISAAGMDAETLKREFGKDLTFWGGGCDTQFVLPQGSPDQVREHVMEQARTLAPGGGFVFQQVHNIMSNVPPQNVVAMFDAINAFRA